MRPDVAVARAAHKRRAFFDDVKSAFDDMFGIDDDDDDKKGDKPGPGPGPGNGNGPGNKTTAEESETVVQVTKTAHTTITRPAVTQTEKEPRPKSTLITASATTTRGKGDPVRVTSIPSEISGLPSTETIPSTLAIAPTTDTPSATRTIDRANSAASTAAAAANPNPTAVANNAGESSTGTKAGIAIGVLAGILAVFVLLWFLFTKRKKQVEQQRLEDDEKINGPFSDSAAIRSPATAPRLSLRPVTQFIPNLMSNSEKHTSQSAGGMLNASSAHAAPLNRPAGASAWERPTANSLNNGGPWDRQTASPSPNSANPFNDSQRIPEQQQSYQAYQPRPVSPLDKDLGGAPVQPVSPIEANALPEFPTPAAAAAGVVAGAALGVAGAGLVRKASMRKDVPAPLDLTRPPPLGAVPPSPAGTEFSVNELGPGQSPGPSAGAADIAAAGGPAQSTVHRVQLDFVPTLQDELELRAGDLVRLLHAYDDGWALCIRLDRSRQGVVPRTCLSVRPVKPRPPPGGGPRGPPVNPNRGPNHPSMNPRGPPPNGQYPRPGSANSQYARPGSAGGQYARPGSANGQYARPGSAGGQYPRPGSAAGTRSQSPGPNNQRSQSPAGMNRRMSPPSQSGMNQQYRPNPQGPPSGPIGRRPVPGQAY